MKVKIAYTVDLDEVPRKIQDFLKQSEELLFSKGARDDFKRVTKAFEENNTQVGLELLESIRNNLIEIDIKLEDCTSLLIDYQQAISQINYKKYNTKEEATSDDEEQ